MPGFTLAYEDSNLDKQNQNLSYYHYTIGQSFKWMAKIRFDCFSPKYFLSYKPPAMPYK